MPQLAMNKHIGALGRYLLQYGKKVDTGHWQALEGVPHTETRELRNVCLEYEIPPSQTDLSIEVDPNLPWAEEEFKNRVNGEPYNPHPSVVNWPWYSPDWAASESGYYSHTYAERYWPKHAGGKGLPPCPGGDPQGIAPHKGIRFDYGDLQDVVSLLAKHPYTRQAYLPVWFPEDTGAVHGERVPCSLGYHWLLRDGRLHVNYFIRSCDFLRYLRDDIYLTCRLTQWLVEQLRNKVLVEDEESQPFWDGVEPGDLTMLIGSLHIFEGDLPKMRKTYG